MLIMPNEHLIFYTADRIQNQGVMQHSGASDEEDMFWFY